MRVLCAQGCMESYLLRDAGRSNRKTVLCAQSSMRIAFLLRDARGRNRVLMLCAQGGMERAHLLMDARWGQQGTSAVCTGLCGGGMIFAGCKKEQKGDMERAYLLRDAGRGDREQEVLQVILVQLQHEAGDREGVLAAVPVQDVEQLLDAAGREAWLRVRPIDGERLARACLPVRKDADIIAINSRLHQMFGVLKHLHTRM